jgi:hypothetical protein
VASSAIETVAVRALLCVGPKVTLMVQFAPAARVDGETGQVLVWMKSLGSVPVMLMLVIVSAVLPLLVRVIVWGELLVPCATSPNDRLAGDSVTAGVFLVANTKTVLEISSVTARLSCPLR